MRTVTRHEISKWLTGLAEIGEPTAVMYHTRMNAFFNFLVREDGTIDKNPMVGMTMLEVASRERLLSERELRAAWHLAPAVHPVFGNAFRFLTLTALRRLEALNLQWDEFNDDDPTALHFDIAGERIKQRGKNKRSFVVPLSAPALAIIGRAASPRQRVALRVSEHEEEHRGQLGQPHGGVAQEGGCGDGHR
jgi:integrase